MRAHLWLVLGFGVTGCFKGPVDLSDYGDIDSSSGSSGATGATGSTGGTGTTGSTGSSGNTSGTTGTVQPPCASLVGASLTLASLSPQVLVNQSVTNATPTQALWSVKLVYASGAPAVGCQISFAEAPGESLVTVGPTASYVDSSGLAGTVVTSRSTAGTANLTASIGVFSLPATLTIQ